MNHAARLFFPPVSPFFLSLPPSFDRLLSLSFLHPLSSFSFPSLLTVSGIFTPPVTFVFNSELQHAGFGIVRVKTKLMSDVSVDLVSSK